MSRACVTLAVLLCTAAPAAAAPLPPSGTLDLSDPPGGAAARWTATEPGGVAGAAVAGVGDFDGDGRADVAVGEPRRDTAAGKDSGAVHILTAAAAGGSLDDAAKVIRIRGAQGDDLAGFDVAAAGDVNGDGLGDVLIGAPGAGGPPPPAAGTTTTATAPAPAAAPAPEAPGVAYLVLGRRDRTEIDLAGDFGGVRIAGGDAGSALGRAVASVPDLNGDGRPEIVVGAPRRDVAGRPDAGSAYVVFGRTGGSVNVATLVEDGAGLRLDGPSANALAGRAVGAIGDLNGDRLPEVLVTAPRAGSGARPGGLAYVVRGRAAAGAIDLAQLGDQGFVIRGPAARASAAQQGRVGAWLGESITGLGDVNGDTLPDLVVGAHLADGPDRSRGGVAYVIHGKADTGAVDTADLGDGGFRIFGVGADDLTGSATGPAGDFNADGLQDVAIGAPFADPLSREGAGAVYVAFGRRGAPSDLDLAEIGQRGLRIAGAAGASTGFALDRAGDVDGDGGDDLVVGSVAIENDYISTLRSRGAGAAAVVFGASGKAGDIPGSEITTDPGYREQLAKGCRAATNIQAVLDDDDYNDQRADPQRIRMVGMQAYVATPRNLGTVIGLTGFASDEEGVSEPIIEPTEITPGRIDELKKAIRQGITGEDEFPGYDTMFRTLADDNPSAGARIMVIDGYTFREVEELEGLTEGAAPTYIVAIGDPPDRNRADIRQMRRVTRATKGRFYEAHSARELERALQAIQSRIRCDLEADDYQADLNTGEEEEIADTEIEAGAHSADVTVTWRDDDEDYEIDEVSILDDDGDEIRELDEEEISEAYDENDLDAPVIGGRGRTFRSLHLRNLRAGTRLRVIVRSDGRRSTGRIYARVTQSRLRR